MAIESLPDGIVEGLLAACERAEPGLAEPLQTHISHLVLSRDRVFKLRKAVRTSFLSFATRAERNADCLNEVRLNRRLAHDVYLGVASIRSIAGRWQLGPIGEDLDDGALEHCVVMRRLPAGRDGQSLVEAGRLGPREIDATARHLARFHADANLGTPVPFPPDRWLEIQRDPIFDCIRDALQQEATPMYRDHLEHLASLARAAADDLEDVLADRGRRGHAVDGHGDLQLAHLWLEDDPDDPRIIDCTEFSEAFRQVDAACDLAFMSMDLRYRGHERLAERLLATYATTSDDFDLYRAIDWFEAYRSMVRSSVALIAHSDLGVPVDQRDAAQQSADRHLALAQRCLSPRRDGRVFVICGGVGSGKSTVGRTLAEACGAVMISSDVIRKRLTGLAPTDHSQAGVAPGASIYDEDTNDRTYDGLLERALPVIQSGRPVVLDATYASRNRRRHVERWSETIGTDAFLVEVRCSESVTRERLERRAAEGSDPSDAGPELLAWSNARFEAPDEWPAEKRLVVSTDDEDWRDQLAAQIQDLD